MFSFFFQAFLKERAIKIQGAIQTFKQFSVYHGTLYWPKIDSKSDFLLKLAQKVILTKKDSKSEKICFM